MYTNEWASSGLEWYNFRIIEQNPLRQRCLIYESSGEMFKNRITKIQTFLQILVSLWIFFGVFTRRSRRKVENIWLPKEEISLCLYECEQQQMVRNELSWITLLRCLGSSSSEKKIFSPPTKTASIFPCDSIEWKWKLMSEVERESESSSWKIFSLVDRLRKEFAVGRLPKGQTSSPTANFFFRSRSRIPTSFQHSTED